MDVEKIDISRFPLKHEVFTRKKELGEELARQRAAMRRAEAATVRRRKVVRWFCAALAVAAMIAAAIFMLHNRQHRTPDSIAMRFDGASGGIQPHKLQTTFMECRGAHRRARRLGLL